MAVDDNLGGVWIDDLDHRFLTGRDLSHGLAERTQTQQFGRTNPMPG
jgi:hypothetical protein